MPALRKEILPAGKYLVSSGSSRALKEFSAKYLNSIAKTANSMIRSGLKIPAPFGHRKDATPESVPDDPSTNAGYWTRFWVSDESGTPALWAEAEIPGSEDDPNSPYYKVKHTAKETSLCIREDFQDGKQRRWKNAILHVALVNNPVVPDQKDFQDTLINMSMVSLSSHKPNESEEPEDPNNETSKAKDSSKESKPSSKYGIQRSKKHKVSDATNLPNLVKKLRDVVKLYLPDDTTHETLIKDLMIAVGQYELSPPSGTSGVEPIPVYMSTHTKDEDIFMTPEQIQAIVDAKVTNPLTNKPFLPEDFKTRDSSSESSLIKAFANKIVEQTRRSITDRINNLVSSGRVTQDYANQHLIPKVEFQMSLTGTKDNPSIADHPLETVLIALEGLPSKPQLNPPGQYTMSNSVEVPNPLLDASMESIPDDKLDEAIKSMLQHLPA